MQDYLSAWAQVMQRWLIQADLNGLHLQGNGLQRALVSLLSLQSFIKCLLLFTDL